MKSAFFHLLLIAALTGGGTAARAERADRDKPMNVEADALRYDDQKQTSVFSGRVVLTKGTILIRGARVEVRQDPAGYQFGLVQGDAGKLAFFRQKRDGLDEFMEGEAEVIEYDSRADTVKFIRKAQLRRYRGTTLGDELSGGVIVYDNNTEVFTIDGGLAQGSPTAPAGRVRVMLTPKPPAEARPTAPGPSLREAPALGGGQK